MKVSDVLRLFHEEGWFLVGTRGSHRQFKHSANVTDPVRAETRNDGGVVADSGRTPRARPGVRTAVVAGTKR